MNPTKENRLDVRPLLARGVEPLAIIMVRMGALTPGQTLTVIAPFLPAPLIERLRGEGFSARAEHCADGTWSVCFEKQ